MEPITRVCKKCGEEKLLEEFTKYKLCKYGRGYTCKVCDNARSCKHNLKYKNYQKEYYLNNKENIEKQQREYRINNKEYIKKHSIEYRINNKEYIKKQRRECVKRLSDSYCSAQLMQRIKGIGCKLTSKDIPQELIELKRVQLQIHRLTKTN